MGNYILSILFIIIIVSFYSLIGFTLFENVKIIKNRFAFYVVLGWLITFFMGWLIGFPMQYFDAGWDDFAKVYSCVLILTVLILVYYQVKFKKRSIKKLITSINYFRFKIHLKKYWFVYLLAIIFTIFSVTNMQPYTINNYDDDFYLVKIVHMVHSTPILSEDYQYGRLLTVSNGKSLAMEQSYRIFNTYELLYSYFGTVFRIPLVFFVRFTMTFHNYLIVFFIYQLFASIFLDCKTSQYGILFFSLLLIADGFAAKGHLPITIRMFENWRFQTGMYMGSSIVRVCSLPLFMYFTYLIFCKCYKIIPIFIISIFVLISFQTLGMSFTLLFLPVFIIGLILNYLLKLNKTNYKNSNRANLTIVALVLSTFIILLYYSDRIITSDIISVLLKKLGIVKSVNSFGLTNTYNMYYIYYLNVFICDFFARCAWIPLLFIIFHTKNIKSKTIAIMSLCVYLIFALNKSKLFVSLISFMFYGSARLLTGVLMVIVCLFGIMIVYIIQSLPKKNLMIPLISFSIVIGNVCFINLRMKELLKYTKSGDGVVNSEYSMRPLTENKYMLPEMFVEVGKYFSKLPNKKYAVYAEKLIQYNGVQYSRQGLLLSSSKIMYSTYHEENKYQSDNIVKMNAASAVLYEYYANRFNLQFYNKYSAVEPYLKEAKLKYAFFTSILIKKALVKKGWKVVVGSDVKGYWLMKSPY